MPHATTPRIPPLDPDEMTEEQRQLSRLGADTVIQVLCRHPELAKATQALPAFLLFQGKLDARARELAILRTAFRSDAEYEWANHVPAALGAGATGTEIDAVADPRASWPPADAALLRAVDELCADAYVSDETWAALAATLDTAEIMELLFTVGFYRMMAGFLNSAGVPVKPGMSAIGTHVEPAAVPTPVWGTGTGTVAGVWHIVFQHPAGNQDVLLTLETAGGSVTGTMRNELLGVTVPLKEGSVDGSHVEFTAAMTEPAPISLAVSATVDGPQFTGTVNVSGGGVFPFSGTRAS